MTPTALETTRLWLATFADPLAVVVFGAILLSRLSVLRAELLAELRAGFATLESAINNQTAHLLRFGRDSAGRQ